MSDFYSSQIPGGDQPRVESKGEANQRLASWIVLALGVFGVRFYEFEREALAKAVGGIVRRWPSVGKWKAPNPAKVQARLIHDP